MNILAYTVVDIGRLYPTGWDMDFNSNLHPIHKNTMEGGSV